MDFTTKTPVDINKAVASGGLTFDNASQSGGQAFYQSTKPSPTVISNVNPQKKVVDMNTQVTQMSEARGQKTDANGVVRNADGSIVPPPPEKPVENPSITDPLMKPQTYTDATGTERNADGTPANIPGGATFQNGLYVDAKGKKYAPPASDTSFEDKQINDTLANMKASTDANTARMIDSIQQKMNQRRNELQAINQSQTAGVQNAMLVSGISQYSPTSALNNVFAQERAGVMELAKLDVQEQDLINEAISAGETKNFQLQEKKLAEIEKKKTEKTALATKLNEKLALETEKIRQKKLKADKDNLIADIYSKGVTDPATILKTLNANGGDFTLEDIGAGLKTLADANGTNTSKMSQDVAEFYALKKEKGGLPVSILGLPSTAEQIAAYLKLKTQAETKAKTTGGTGGSNVPKVNGVVMDYDDPNYTVTVIRGSKGKKEMTGEQSKPITKALQAISQVDDLQKALVGQQTSPIWGTIRSANPYDVKAQIIKGQLTALIPNLARGVYGEVGVLTDMDIENYSRTLGNLKSEKEVNDALIAITQKAAFNSIKTNLEAMAASGRDVSGFEPIYKNAKKNIDAKLPKVSPVGSSAPQDFINNPLPGQETATKAYNPSVWNLFKK